MDISIIVPAYNEELVLHRTLSEIDEYARRRFETYEIIVVDDGSEDETAREAQKTRSVRLIRLERNEGKGQAVKRGMLEGTGDLLLFMDADNSTRIVEMTAFLEQIKEYDIIIGSRAMQRSDVKIRQSWLKVLGGRLGNVLIRTMLNLPIRDTQCGFKLFRRSARSVFELQTKSGWSFDFEVLFIAKQRNFKIKELPVSWINNFDSRVKTSDYFTTLVDLVDIRVKHLRKKYA